MATIPSLALIPSGYKASKVYSVLPTDGTGDFDFTRSGNATRVNSEGLIELVSTNVPRLNYPLIDGVVQGCPSLLLEPERKNDFTNSEDYSTNWARNQVDVDVDDIISPDGTQNADFISENTTTNPHFMFQDVGTTTTSDYTISIFAKHNSRILQIFAGGGDISGNPYANFDLENGVFNNNGCNDAFIQDYGNGWYRCGVVVTSAVTSGFNPCFGLANNLNSSRAVTYTGDGTSGVYLWGAQLEAGSYPTSYIPTSGTIGTRSAETCNNAGDVNTFNSSEGVLFAEISGLADDLTRRIITITDGTLNNIVKLEYKNVSNQIEAVLYNGNTQCLILHNLSDETEFNKIAFKYKQDDFSLFVNGTKVGTDVSGSIFPSNTLSNLSFYQGNSNYFYGNTKQIQYFPTALNDSDLETLTSWDSFSDMATSQLYTIE
jgi:hypothetical protein